jgi:diguanylate cyclase (GGDEF)-like protein
MNWRFGLQVRYLILMFIALGLTLLAFVLAWNQQRDGFRAVAAISSDAMHDSSIQGVRKRGEAMARLLADAMTNPMYYFDLAAIGETARSALQQSDVSYVLVYDREGRVIHDGSGDIPTYGQPMQDAFAAEAVAAEQLHTQWSDQAVDVAHPIRIGDERLGGVRVGLSLAGPAQLEADAQAAMRQRAEMASERSLTTLALMFGGLMLLSLGFAWGVSRHLVRPIRRLALSAQQIEAGNYRPDVQLVRRQDELGDLERAFGRMRDSVDRHDRDIRRLAYGDALTGLPNRLAFRELLDQRIVTAQAEGSRLALLFVDLDDFKRVNDTLGHDAGDEVLGQFSSRLEQVLGRDAGADGRAVVARLGGDEFVALIAGEEVRDASAMLAETLLAELQRPMAAAGRQVFLGGSVGITVFPEDAASAAALLKNGDIAMYQAKVAGKNCYRFYSKVMDQAVERRVRLEQDLRGAWERGELSLAYQPIFQLASGHLVGAEALLRWQHPQHGVIPPSVFVEVAEQTGMIENLGRQVLGRACTEAMRWKRESEEPFVSVNVSARQLRMGDLATDVATVLRDSGLPPQRLHLEITETAVMGDEVQTSALLARLRAMGVKIWLDDFGTGFSGLSHLRRVPVDGVKIDRSFVADVLRDPDDLALTSAIIAMAHSLGITAVAEGVENEGQFAILRDRGCDQAQGYWLGRPMPAGELARRLVA